MSGIVFPSGVEEGTHGPTHISYLIGCVFVSYLDNTAWWHRAKFIVLPPPHITWKGLRVEEVGVLPRLVWPSFPSVMYEQAAGPSAIGLI